eukprot:5251613-Amphidinium_carterae.1
MPPCVTQRGLLTTELWAPLHKHSFKDRVAWGANFLQELAVRREKWLERIPTTGPPQASVRSRARSLPPVEALPAQP